MRSWASRASIAALAGIAALPVIGQEAPKSILPPGFEDAPPPVTAPAAPVPGADPQVPAAAPTASEAPVAPLPAAPTAAGPVIDPLLIAPAAGDVRTTGWLTPQAGGYGPGTFSG